MAADGRLLGKRGLAAGDKLILTKPLGTGVLFAAHMQLLADGRQIAAAIDSMLASNAAAAELALAHGAGACTDITGFGLLGHLLEMLGERSGASLQLGSLPLLPGALEHLRRGIRSSMHVANTGAHSLVRSAADLDQDLLQILFDPQTSGGLLIAVAAERAAALLDELHGSAYLHAQIIGEVVTRGATQAPVQIT